MITIWSAIFISTLTRAEVEILRKLVDFSLVVETPVYFYGEIK